MAQLQENLNGIVAAFCVCTRSDGKCSPLSREELRQLIEQEFADAMENPQDPKTIKKVLCFLDDDSNCRVDFSELLSLVFRVAKACYKPLQYHQALGDGQEPRAQEKAGREQLPGPSPVRKVSSNQGALEQGVNNQVQDPDNDQIQEEEISKQDQDNRQTQEGETSKQHQDTCQTQEDEISNRDQDNHQRQEVETPELDQNNHQTQEDEISKQDQDNHQTQEDETSKQDWDIRQTQEGETSKQDPSNHQTQQGVTPEEQDTCQDDRSEELEEDPERGENLVTATPEKERNTHKAEESETSKQDPKADQAKETEAPGLGSNHQQSPDPDPAEQDLNHPSESQERDPNKTQVCDVPQQDPKPNQTQNLLPPQQSSSPHWDSKPWGTHHDPAFYELPESEVLELEHSGAEAPSRPVQQQEDAHHRRQPTMEQQLLQSLYQWPLPQ